MNWEAISAIAESIGVIAVLITLIYLAIQVRQNTEMSRQSILRNQTDRYLNNCYFMAGNSGIMDIFMRSMADPDSVTREEWWRFGSYLYGMFKDYEEMYYFNTSGRQEDYRWESSQRDLRFYLSRPGGRKWWRSQGREMLSDQFVEFVDGLITS